MDWDIHHGNGTQHIFGEDPQVRGLGQGLRWSGDGQAMPQGHLANQLLSPLPTLSPQCAVHFLHRYDHGTFFPMGNEGACTRIGKATGTGFTVNVAWNGPPHG